MSQYVDKAGVFECQVVEPVSGWFGEQGEKNTPFIRIPCRVISGPMEGRTITWFGWLTDAAADNTIRALAKAFPQWNGDLDAVYDGNFSFANTDCQIVAEAEMYNNEPRIKAKWLNPAGGGGGKPMEAGKVASLLKKLGGKSKALVKAERTANPAPRVPVAASGQSPNLDDDIPF